MKRFVDTDTARAADARHVTFVLELCDYRSEGNKDRNFDSRLQHAYTAAGLDEKALDDPVIQELMHYYLSYFQNHAKYQLLLSYSITQWRINRLFLKEWADQDVDSVTKQVTMMDKMTDLSYKLNQKIEFLYSEIYGDDKIIEGAKEQVVQALSPEQRMKNRKKLTT